MITLKSEKEIEIMARAGRIVGATLALMRQAVKPGVSTEDLDAQAEQFIRSHPGATPSFKGLYGFPKSLCVSINEEIVHGIPSTRRILREGSIVSIDVGVHLQGYHADAAITVPVGEIAPEAARLLEVTQAALAAGVEQARLGNHVGDIGHAVGQRMHEDPQVPNHGQPHRGPRLQAGMTLAIEPMITAGDYSTRTLDDKWTVVTADGSLAAHFEHTVAITKDGPRILTKAA